MLTLIEVAGWLGALCIVAAYALITAGKVTPTSVSYQMLNIVGAIGFIVNSGWHGAIPSVALNVVWLGIGFFGLLRYFKARGASRDTTS